MIRVMASGRCCPVPDGGGEVCEAVYENVRIQGAVKP